MTGGDNDRTHWSLADLHDIPWSVLEDAYLRVEQEVDNRDPLDPRQDDRTELVDVEEREGRLIGRAEGTGLYYDPEHGGNVSTRIGSCIYLDTPEETVLEVRTDKPANELLTFEMEVDDGE